MDYTNPLAAKMLTSIFGADNPAIKSFINQAFPNGVPPITPEDQRLWVLECEIAGMNNDDIEKLYERMEARRRERKNNSI